jgi:hypothetical protein
MVGAAAALAGSLDDFPAPPLLRLVARARHSGTLHVLTATQPLAICFEDGAITYAGPTDLEAARTALLATGLVGPDAWDSAGALPPGLPGAPRPVERRPVADTGRSPLEEALADLAVNTVFELLLPSAASFWFEPSLSHRLAGTRGLEAEQLISEAAARLESWRMIADVIPSTSVVVRFAGLLPPGVERVTFDRDEWPVLAAIDGRRDVASIISHTGLSAFGVCGVLHRLITLGVAEPYI